jgi:hypothetical protein
MLRFEFLLRSTDQQPVFSFAQESGSVVSHGKRLSFESESSNKRTDKRLPVDNGVMCYPAQGIIAFAGLR